MKTRLIIQIPSKKRMVVFMQILYIHFMLWIRDILGLPFAITYLTDILTIYMIVFHFFSIKNRKFVLYYCIHYIYTKLKQLKRKGN